MESHSPTVEPRIKASFLFALALLHLAWTFLFIVPGYLNADEAIYHWMTKSLYETGGLELWNGYQEFPTSLLIHPLIQLHDGRLFPQYPCVFAFMAIPFYHFAGFLGLFLLNSICFVGSAMTCFLTARRLFQDVNLALNSCLLFVLATFAWDYSQAAWPHAAEMFCASAAFYFFVCSYCSETAAASRSLALAAGLVAGFGVGVRLDMVLVFPGMIFSFLFARPWRPIEALFIAVGAIPGLALIGWSNLAKFGVFNPLSYGQMAQEAMPSRDVIIAATSLVVLAWGVTRQRYASFFRAHRYTLCLLCIAGLLLAPLLCPRVLAFVREAIQGGSVSLIDMRLAGSHVSLGGAERTAGGGVVSVGAHRKALLQSMPYLTILLVPLMRIVLAGKDFAKLCILFAVPFTVIGYYSFAFPKLAAGGLCLNIRYYVVCLPFFSVASAYALRELRDLWGECISPRALLVTGLLTLAAYCLLTHILSPTLDQQQFPYLVGPLLMAGFIAVFTLAGTVVRFDRYPLLSATAWVCLIAAVAWSGLVAFLYDYPNHRQWRSAHYACSRALFEVIPDDSVLFTEFGTFPPSVGLKEKKSIRIALMNTMKQQEDVTDLLDFHLKAHRRAFGFLSIPGWRQFERALRHPYKMTPVMVLPGFEVREISDD